MTKATICDADGLIITMKDYTILTYDHNNEPYDRGITMVEWISKKEKELNAEYIGDFWCVHGDHQVLFKRNKT